MIESFISWLKAEDISTVPGAGHLVSTLRIMLVAGIALIFILGLIFK